MQRGAKKWDFGAANAAGYAQAVSFKSAFSGEQPPAAQISSTQTSSIQVSSIEVSSSQAGASLTAGSVLKAPLDEPLSEPMSEPLGEMGALRLVPQAKNTPVAPRSLPDRADDTRWTTGLPLIDQHLPAGHINRSGLHEIEPLRATDMPSLTGFSFALLARLRSNAPIIWCVTTDQVGEYGHLYAHGVQRFGLSPSQIIFSKVSKAVHLQFAMEEALKTEGIAAVLGEGPRPCFTGSRRLSLLARQQARPCLFLANKSEGERGSAAMTRWQVTPSPGVEDPNDPFGPGLPTWHLALTRVRGGNPMPALPAQNQMKDNSQPLRIVWDEQTHSFHSAAVFCRGAVSESRPHRSEPPQALVG